MNEPPLTKDLHDYYNDDKGDFSKDFVNKVSLKEKVAQREERKQKGGWGGPARGWGAVRD